MTVNIKRSWQNPGNFIIFPFVIFMFVFISKLKSNSLIERTILIAIRTLKKI